MVAATETFAAPAHSAEGRSEMVAFFVMAAVLVVAPFFIYPLFLTQALCFALFACAFNLLIGYVGLLSFGHALYFGWASYLAAHAAKVWGLPPELAILTGAATGAVLGLVAGASALGPGASRYRRRSRPHGGVHHHRRGAGGNVDVSHRLR